MSSGVNRVILVGRLGADPELRTTQTGQNVCTLSLATSETWVKDGKKEERTEWHRVILWARQAEIAHKYLRKGRMVYIEGRIQTRTWQDNQGQKRYTTEIIGTNMQFLEGQGQASVSENNRDIPEPETPSEFSGSDASYAKSNLAYSVGNSAATSANGSGKHALEDDIPF